MKPCITTTSYHEVDNITLVFLTQELFETISSEFFQVINKTKFHFYSRSFPVTSRNGFSANNPPQYLHQKEANGDHICDVSTNFNQV